MATTPRTNTSTTTTTNESVVVSSNSPQHVDLNELDSRWEERRWEQTQPPSSSSTTTTTKGEERTNGGRTRPSTTPSRKRPSLSSFRPNHDTNNNHNTNTDDRYPNRVTVEELETKALERSRRKLESERSGDADGDHSSSRRGRFQWSRSDLRLSVEDLESKALERARRKTEGDDENDETRRDEDLCVARVSKLASSPVSSAAAPVAADTPRSLPTFVAGTPTSNVSNVARRGSPPPPDYVVLNTARLVLCNDESFTDDDEIVRAEVLTPWIRERKTQALFVFCLFVLCLSAFVVRTHTDARERYLSPFDSPTSDDHRRNNDTVVATDSDADTTTTIVDTTRPPSAPPSPTRLTPWERLYQTLLSVSDEAALTDRRSPQWRALTWLINDNSLDLIDLVEIDTFRIHQRYVLVLLWLTMDGDNWVSSENGDDGHFFATRGGHECDWYDERTGKGVSCDEEGRVTRLVLNEVMGTDVESFSHSLQQHEDEDHPRHEPQESDDLEGFVLGTVLARGFNRTSVAGSPFRQAGPRRSAAVVPRELGELSSLRVLRLDGNRLEGTLPTEMGRLDRLETLNVQNNRLSGPLPTELGALVGLQRLSTHSNAFSSVLPSELGNLVGLEALRTHANVLTGTIPSTLARLRRAHTLWLHENRLTGDASFLCDDRRVDDDSSESELFFADVRTDCLSNQNVTCSCCERCY